MIEVLGQPFKADGGVRPQGGISAADGVKVPTLTATGIPHGMGQGLIQLIVPIPLCFVRDFNFLPVVLPHLFKRLANVADLAFNHEQNGIVSQCCVGTKQHKKVGEPMHGGAFVGLGSTRPEPPKIQLVFAHNEPLGNGGGGLEAGAKDNHVDWVSLTGLVHNGCGRDLGDGPIDQFDVWEVERGIVVIGHEHAFTAHGVAGRECSDQGWVIDLPF